MDVKQLIAFLLAFICTAVNAYEAPLIGDSNPRIIPNSYIVSLRKTCTARHHRIGDKRDPEKTYNENIERHFKRIGVSRKDTFFKNITDIASVSAYAGYFPPTELAKIRSDSCVKQISSNLKLEKDFTMDPQVSTGQSSSISKASNRLTQRQIRDNWKMRHQHPASWNLVMTSESNKDVLEPFDDWSRDNWGTYDYEDNSGAGVDIYTLSASFDLNDKEIRGRAKVLKVYNDAGRLVRYTRPGPVDNPLSRGDKSYYATVVAQCAACIAAGGEDEGVSKKAQIVNIPSEIEERRPGLRLGDHVTEHMTLAKLLIAMEDVLNVHSRKIAARPAEWRGSIFLLPDYVWAVRSLSQIEFALLNLAKQLDQVGILIIASAGDEGHQLDGISSDYSLPCQLPGVVCVGSVDHNYQRWVSGPRKGKSSYGPAVTIWAPGYSIPCSNLQDAYNLVSGTSLAAAHVAGAAAIFISYIGRNPMQVSSLYETYPVRNYLFTNAKRGWMNVGNQPSTDDPQTHSNVGRNLLLNTGINSMSEMPFKEEASYELLEQMLNEDREDLSANESPAVRAALEPGPLTGAVTCHYWAPANRKQLRRLHPTDFSATQQLLLRLLFERAHLNSYDPDSPFFEEAPGYAKHSPIIPCSQDACISLVRRVGPWKQEIIPDSRIFEKYILHIMTYCESDDSERFTGGTMQIEEPAWRAFNITLFALPYEHDFERDNDPGTHGGDDVYDEDLEEERDRARNEANRGNDANDPEGGNQGEQNEAENDEGNAEGNGAGHGDVNEGPRDGLAYAVESGSDETE